MSARIYQRPKNAMQSGKARTGDWILDFVPAEAKKPDPLMGWAGSGDMRQQVQLRPAVSDGERHTPLEPTGQWCGPRNQHVKCAA